jgi:hypothetical protein
MEYVDGEDLASLLRQIGRLPEEKATQYKSRVSSVPDWRPRTKREFSTAI